MSFREVSTSVKCFAMLGCGLWFHGNIVSAGASRANGANSLVFSLSELPPRVDGRGLCFQTVFSGVSFSTFSEAESLVSLTALSLCKHKDKKFLPDLHVSSNDSRLCRVVNTSSF